MEFTGKLANELSKIAEETLTKKFAELGHDITIRRGGGKYGSQEFTMKLVLSTKTDTGETQAELDYKEYANLYELPLDMLGAKFSFNGKFFTVTGLLPNRRKNDIQIENSNGKTFVAPHESVVRAYKLHIAKKELFDGNPIPAVTI